MASMKGNQKIAKKRSIKWQESLATGRLNALISPSNLRLYRVKKKVSQVKIAKELDISTSTYGAIERGKRLVKEVAVKQIASLLKTDIKNLFKKSTKNKYAAIIK